MTRIKGVHGPRSSASFIVRDDPSRAPARVQRYTCKAEADHEPIRFRTLRNRRTHSRSLPDRNPSWGFANTGTRFGKFVQPAAASTLEEKFNDAAEVHRLTGATPTLALHVLWDLPHGLADVEQVQALERSTGLRAGSISPNIFQDQQYKYGSLCNPDPDIRAHALQHVLDSVEIARRLHSRDITPWVADGSNYPGTQSIRKRIEWLESAFETIHQHLAPDQRVLIEYKPFEPAFYHTDIADWGMSRISAATPDRKPSSSSIPAITISRRTSNRLLRGSCIWACSADSTSTTADMPTTT